jgi:hypothetical protein
MNDTSGCLVEKRVSLATKAFSETAKNMNNDKVKFAVSVKEVQNQFFHQEWKSLFSGIPFPLLVCLSKEQYLYLYLWLSNGLIFGGRAPWPKKDCSAIKISDTDLIGWTPQCICIVLLVEEGER